MIKPITIRTVLSLAVASNWDICQLDVTNAFLHGNLSKDVYMTQPPSFVHSSYPTHVCHLRKALYGLKQAPRAWYSRLSNRLLHLGFHGCKSNTSLFIYRSSKDLILFLIYVDDIIVTSPNPNSINTFITTLQTNFALKDLGPLHFFLVLKLTRRHQACTSFNAVTFQTYFRRQTCMRQNLFRPLCLPALSSVNTLAHLSRTQAHIAVLWDHCNTFPSLGLT